MKRNKGFTFIELLITLTVLAISFLPLMRMYSAALEQLTYVDDLTAAKFLAQEGMEKLKNINLTMAQIKSIGSVWEPPLGSAPVTLNGKRWRALRKVVQSSDPLEVHIQVFKDEDMSRKGSPARPVIELVTLIEDLEWSASE